MRDAVPPDPRVLICPIMGAGFFLSSLGFSVSRLAALSLLVILLVIANPATGAPAPICAIDMGSNSFRRIVGTFESGRYAQRTSRRRRWA